MQTHTLDGLAAAVRNTRNLGIVGHVSPDADCTGAVLSLALAVVELGVYPHVALPLDTAGRRIQFLLDEAGLSPATAHELARCESFAVLDTAKLKRVNIADGPAALAGKQIICVDHHTTNELFGQVNWVEENRSSTCEMVYELLVALGCQITPTIATLLYAGIHSDTHGFSLSNTTPRSLEIAHHLAAAGARIREVCERLMRSHSRGEFALQSAVYRNTRVSPDGRIAWSTLSYDEIRETGCDATAIDDQVEIPRSIEGITLAMLLTEGEPGIVRVNFRGERGTSVLDLAQQFGGGGHRVSAGARVRGSLGEVTERVLATAVKFLSKFEANAARDTAPRASF
jgi:phosphoesterase RecJ-like protein